MKASEVAEKLMKHGYSSIGFLEPVEHCNGEVQVRNNIWVVVPAEGDALYVVMKLPNGEFVDGKPRRRFAYILKDISCFIYQGWPRP